MVKIEAIPNKCLIHSVVLHKVCPPKTRQAFVAKILTVKEFAHYLLVISRWRVNLRPVRAGI
jgi:hypothetical protein